MKRQIRLKFTTAVTIAFVLALAVSPAVFAADKPPAGHDHGTAMPDPKDHEFNTNIPTAFSGKITEMGNADTGKFKVYETGPADAKSAILMIHEWWGLNPHVKGVADQLGRLGYAVYAPDLFEGWITDDADKAGKHLATVDNAKATAKLKVVLQEMKKKYTKVGTVGWCFGGGQSFQASLAEPVDATVIYYGPVTGDPSVLSKLKGPVLAFFAKKDTWITPQMAQEFEKGLKEAKVKAEVFHYDADHAFANPSGNRFMLEPARDTWDKTLKFFEKNLK